MRKTAYSRVEIGEDGSETYFNDQGDEVNFHMTVPQIEEMIAQYAQLQQAAVSHDPSHTTS